MSTSTWREFIGSLLACWILGWLGLIVAGSVLPNAQDAAIIARDLVWPWVIGIAILGWLYLVRR